jgi:hypothetical protein
MNMLKVVTCAERLEVGGNVQRRGAFPALFYKDDFVSA